MSDRIGVFANGSLAQIGTAHQIYQQPSGPFVANFVGTSNLFDAEHASRLYGREAPFVIRPERLAMDWDRDQGTDDGVTSWRGQVTSLVYVGHATQVRVALDGGPAVVVLVHGDLPGDDSLVGRDVAVRWTHRDVVWLPAAA